MEYGEVELVTSRKSRFSPFFHLKTDLDRMTGFVFPCAIYCL